MLIGKQYGKLKVVGYSHTDGKRYWKCLCECGKNLIASTGHLNSGGAKSCGCVMTERFSKC